MEKEKRTHGVQMNSIIRAWKLLEILKAHTDADHKLTQTELLGLMKQKEGSCTEKPLRTDLRNLMAVLNPAPEEYGERTDEFRIVYDGIGTEGQDRISGVRYVHEFSNRELELLIELVKSSEDMDREQCALLEDKLKGLGSCYYQYRTDSVKSVPRFSTINKEHLWENLNVIRDAITGNKKISFLFNGYNRDGALSPVRPRPYMVSPYYVLIYGMKYYLLANTEGYENASVYRLDLMSEAKLTDEPRKSIRDVEELKHVSPGEYMERHMNMNYDMPLTVTLKVRSDGYTVLHDCFGDHYTYKRAIDAGHDEVTVVCSQQAILDWAIQFSGRIEILRPRTIRKKILEKAQTLMQQYKN